MIGIKILKVMIVGLTEVEFTFFKGGKGVDERVDEAVGKRVDEAVGKGVDEGVGKDVGKGVGEGVGDGVGGVEIAAQLHLETLLQLVMGLLLKSLHIQNKKYIYMNEKPLKIPEEYHKDKVEILFS